MNGFFFKEIIHDLQQTMNIKPSSVKQIPTNFYSDLCKLKVLMKIYYFGSILITNNWATNASKYQMYLITPESWSN